MSKTETKTLAAISNSTLTELEAEREEIIRRLPHTD